MNSIRSASLQTKYGILLADKGQTILEIDPHQKSDSKSSSSLIHFRSLAPGCDVLTAILTMMLLLHWARLSGPPSYCLQAVGHEWHEFLTMLGT